MIFSSANNQVLFLDPHNWQQQQPGSEIDINNQFSLPAPLPISTISGGGASGTTITPGTGSTRSSSMAERARQAKVPQPGAALKCPRCESTNTKFGYFNNYSLTQPRHFCKTCRRYWTRGGSLRNVPVGGGCRRNKRSKKSSSSARSKSPLPLERSACRSLSTTHDHSTIGHFLPPHAHLPLLPSLPHLSDYCSSDLGPGLNFTRIHPLTASNGSDHGDIGVNMEFQIGSNSWGGEQWRLQQVQNYPFLVGSERPSGMYQLEAVETVNTEEGNPTGDLRSIKPLHSGVDDQMDSSVKMEENQMSRNFLSIMGNNGHYWGGNSTASSTAWTNDLSAAAGFANSTSSTSHLL